MRGMIRAAAYVPVGSVDGRPTAGADEDGFTMATTAIERLGSGGVIGRLQLVGDLPSTAESDLSRFLGSPVRSERFGAGEAGWDAAARAALDPARGSEEILIVAVDLAANGSPGDRPSCPDAAVSIRVGERPKLALGDVRPGPSREGPSATAPMFRAANEGRPVDPELWVGDWDPKPTRPRPGGGTRPTLRPNEPVSQGAYVPHPRYLENLPSRWWFAAEKCSACGTVTFPSRGRCRKCGAREGLESVRLPRDGGKVIAATVIGPGGQPTEFDAQVESTGPYGVVLVEIAPGARVTLQVSDALPGALAIGDTVATGLRRIYAMEGEWRYGRKAVPRAPESGRGVEQPAGLEGDEV